MRRANQIFADWSQDSTRLYYFSFGGGDWTLLYHGLVDDSWGFVMWEVSRLIGETHDTKPGYGLVPIRHQRFRFLRLATTYQKDAPPRKTQAR